MNEHLLYIPAAIMQDEKNAIFQMRFPQKLWYLLNMRTDAILWGGTGRTILLNYRILHNYLQCDSSIFKTTNISSFVRQLNLYGFRKVTSHLQDPLCNSSNPYMHEYVHDQFQFGRPELLNKITRKALPIKKHCRTSKPMSLHNMFESSDLADLSLTPLQKARRALHAALRKAAQDIINNSSKQFCNLKFECDEVPEDIVESEENEFDPHLWSIQKPALKETQAAPKPVIEITPPEPKSATEDTSHSCYEQPPQDLINFNDVDEPQTNNDGFTGQFLSMPDLDAEPTEPNSGVELLAEFDIYHDTDQGIAQTSKEKINDKSLNCVLPFVSNDQNEDVTMDQNNNSMSDHYQDGEWDQMFNDMLAVASKGPNQECGSDLKELYSQISRTIDLLNS